MKEILIATGNSDKFEEIISLLPKNQFKFYSLSNFPNIPKTIENEETLEGNALKKAKEAFEKTKILTLADDTGLEVYYLNLEPGVFAARYAGENATYEDNVQKLLINLSGVPIRRRGARFRSVVAIVGNNILHTCDGIVEGKIIEEPRGTNGFGYDPVFIPNGSSKTYAEMGLDEKNIFSHRSIALNKAVNYLQNL